VEIQNERLRTQRRRTGRVLSSWQNSEHACLLHTRHSVDDMACMKRTLDARRQPNLLRLCELAHMPLDCQVS
jgi:hypothetical protein